MVSWFVRNAERLALLAGAGLMVVGVAMIYAPAAYILAGAMLVGATLWRAP
jgi:hypothetical protein